MKTKNQDCVRMGIIGMGGFAAAHQRAAIQLEEEGDCRLVCSCDPDLAAFDGPMKHWRFAERGVRVFSDYIEMLDFCGTELDLVVIPTPIQCHARMHRECAERGIPSYLEKPPTLLAAELDDMIACDRKLEKRSQVGFNFIVERERLELKRRILAGDFGRLKRVGYRGFAARSADYFHRNEWAGRLRVGEHAVLDSCMGNAMAHHVHNSLFWAGDDEVFSWSPVASVRAEVYRANEIETADTFFVKAKTASGVAVDLAITHACDWADKHHEEIVWCEKAVIRYFIYDRYVIEWEDGGREEVALPPDYLLPINYRFYHQYLRGERERPATLLEDCRPFVELYNLTFLSAGGITTIAPEHRTTAEDDGHECRVIANIRPVAEAFIESGRLPSLQGVPWAVPPARTARSGDVASIEAVIREIA